MNDLIHQQQQNQQTSSATTGWQTQKQGSFQESNSGPSASPRVFPPFSPTLHPSANNISTSAIPTFPSSMHIYWIINLILTRHMFRMVKKHNLDKSSMVCTDLFCRQYIFRLFVHYNIHLSIHNIVVKMILKEHLDGNFSILINMIFLQILHKCPLRPNDKLFIFFHISF